jgi:hypothetical protein
MVLVQSEYEQSVSEPLARMMPWYLPWVGLVCRAALVSGPALAVSRVSKGTPSAVSSDFHQM